MTWPWEGQQRVPAPRLRGTVDSAKTYPAFKPGMSLEQMMSLLCTGVPGVGVVDVSLNCKGDELEIEIANETCRIQKRFLPAGEGYDVVFDLYALPEAFQNSGHAKRMFRNLLTGYSKLDIGFIVTHANHQIGGYTWARMAARPKDGLKQRDVLLDRLHPIAKRERFTTAEAQALEKLIEDAPIERLMYEVACSVSAEGRRLGKPLLIGHRWDAFWDLTDPDHRMTIAEALA
jgi:hypothetical protein